MTENTWKAKNVGKLEVKLSVLGIELVLITVSSESLECKKFKYRPLLFGMFVKEDICYSQSALSSEGGPVGLKLSCTMWAGNLDYFFNFNLLPNFVKSNYPCFPLQGEKVKMIIFCNLGIKPNPAQLNYTMLPQVCRKSIDCISKSIFSGLFMYLKCSMELWAEQV